MTTNDQEKARRALRDLESLGLAPDMVKVLWKDLEARIHAHETGKPGEWDVMYTVPSEAPKTHEHFEKGGEGLPQVLAPQVLWAGHHYTLTAGQREWLRDNTPIGVSPRTVTIGWVEVWAGTRHPRAFMLKADVHLDSRLRRHTSVEFVVREAGKFFHESAMIDAELAKPREVELVPVRINIGAYYTLEKWQKWALNDLCKDQGVEFGKKVQLTLVSARRYRFEDVSTGKVGSVDPQKMWDTFKEYENLKESEYSGPRRKKKDPEKDALAFYESSDKMMEDLEKEFGE